MRTTKCFYRSFVVTGVSMVAVIGACGCSDNPSHKQGQELAEIKNLGGTVKIDEESPDESVIEVHLRDSKVTDSTLVHVKGLLQLTYLDLRNTQITGAGLVHLKGLTNLQTLKLYDTSVTDAGLVHLARLNTLEKLSLGNTNVTDAGLVYLMGLTNLSRLYLTNTQVTDTGVNNLKRALPKCYIVH